MLNIGDIAPDFSLPETESSAVSLSDSLPSAVVLFFYPRDNTKGCTIEAIDFSAAQADFADAGARVFGISKDSLKSHEKFRDKHALSVPLLSDELSDVCERYGVWKEKKMYGKTFMGIERTTVLINGQGEIAQIWRKVKVAGHVEQVLAAVKALAS